MRGKYRIPFYMSTDCEGILRRFLVLNPAKRCSLEVSGKTGQDTTLVSKDQTVQYSDSMTVNYDIFHKYYMKQTMADLKYI